MVNLYGTSEISTEVRAGLFVKLRQETDYPASGRVTVHVDPAQPAQFPVRLRIPYWCTQPRVSVNGEPPSTLGAKPGGFFVLNRSWKPGDRVQLDLRMPVRLIKGRQAQAGRVAVLRGPQVFGLSRARHPELANADLRLLTLDPASIMDTVPDVTLRPNGQAIPAVFWSEGAFRGKKLELTLTEFADPDSEAVYFTVPNPDDPALSEDKLMQSH